MDIRRKYGQFTVKASEDAGTGSGSGWGAIYGNEDRDAEIMAPGVFAESLATCLRDGFLGMGHDWKSGIGTFTDLKEDPQGLYIAWEWHGDAEAQMYRQRVKERLDRGKTVGLSVGFRVKEYTTNEEDKDKFGYGKRTITKGELFEVSVVTVPANPQALVTTAKGLELSVLPATLREFEELLRGIGFPRSQAEAIASKGFRVIESQGEPDAAMTAEIQRYLNREAQFAGIS